MEMPLDSAPLSEARETGLTAEGEEPALSADGIIDLMLTVMSDGLDHPELWASIPGFVEAMPELVGKLQQRLEIESRTDNRTALLLLLGMCGAASQR